MEKHFVLAVLAATVALAACGGGDGAAQDPMVTPNEVPDSALASAAAYTAYVGTLAASETAPPLDVSKISNAPTSETAPPAAL